MQLTVRKWGNSLGVRIPPALREDLGIKENSQVEVIKEGKNWMLRALPSLPSVSLQALTAQITKGNQHRDFDEGKPQGNEVW